MTVRVNPLADHKWARVPSKDFGSEAEAQAWADKRTTDRPLRVQVIRPKGWGLSGRPAFGVFAQQF